MLASLISHRARTRHLIAAAAVYTPLAVLMFWWPGLVGSVSRSCGLPPFDVRGYWNAEDARTMVDACGGTGRTAYLLLQVVDLVYPAALAWFLLVLCALLLRSFGSRAWPVLVPIIVMTLLDYTENAGVWILLARWPEVDTPVADAAGVATAVKRAFGFLAFSTPLVLAVVHLVRRCRHRIVRSRQCEAATEAEDALAAPQSHDQPTTGFHEERGVIRGASRPPVVWVVAGLLGFLSVTAAAGGAEMVVYPHGNAYLPASWLDRLPVLTSWLLPGLVLGLGFGVGSAVTALGLLRRFRLAAAGPVERCTGRHWSWTATVLIGVGLIAWIVLELTYLPQRSWLEPVYAVVGASLAILPLTRRFRAYGSPSATRRRPGTSK